MARLSALIERVPPAHRKFLLRSVCMAFGVRVGLVLAGYITAYIIIGREDVHFTDAILETFKRWDSSHYERISTSGYPTSGDYREDIVFLPLFPYTVKVFGWLFGSWLVAALFVSAVASVAAGYFLQAMIWHESGDQAEAGRGLWYFFLFPTAYFLAMPYTEALFMAALLGSFYCARRGWWPAAGLLGALATAARLQGVLLVPALIIEALHQGKWRGVSPQALWIALAPLGFAVYLLINLDLHGDAFAFVDFEKQYWFHERQAPWDTIKETYDWITIARADFTRVAIYEFRAAAAIVTAFFLIAGARWLRPSYQFFGWATLIMFLSVSFQLSLPRYVLTIFPMFLVMARVSKNEEVHSGLLACSAVLFGTLYVVYATRWGF